MKIVKSVILFFATLFYTSSANISAQLIATLPQSAYNMAWSSSGDLLYVSTREGLHVIDTTTGTVDQLYQTQGMGFFSVAPDGRIAFFDGEVEVGSSNYFEATLTILSADPATAPLTRTTPVPMADGGTRLRWSPDGTRIAGTTLGGQVYDADTGELLAQLPHFDEERGGPGFLDVDWLDDEHLVLLSLDRRIYVYDLLQKAFVLYMDLPEDEFATLPLSPDRQHVVVLSPSHVRYVNATSGQTTATLVASGVVDSPRLTATIWLPSDEGVVLTRAIRGDMAVCSAESSGCTLVQRGDGGVLSDPALHPNGRLLAYATGRDIYLLDLTDALAALGLADGASATPTP